MVAGQIAPKDESSVPTTIDQVIAALEGVLEWSKETPSRVGYFACLYLDVTRAIHKAIAEGDFEDPARISRLDVAFACRYLTALEQFRTGGTPSRCWGYAFSTCGRWWPTVMQHMIIAANAHINIDLGVAVAEVVPATELLAFHRDFEKVNQILSSLVPTVQNGLGLIFPFLARLTALFGVEERWLIDLEMAIVRERAWDFAQELAALDPAKRNALIAQQEGRCFLVAKFLRWPGFLVGCLLQVARLGERWSIKRKIEALEQRIEKRREALRQGTLSPQATPVDSYRA